MSILKVALLSDNAAVARVVADICDELLIPYDVDVYHSTSRYLQAPIKYHLSIVDPTLISLQHFGSILQSFDWVYLSETDHTPNDAVMYRPLAACDVRDRVDVKETITAVIIQLSSEVLGGPIQVSGPRLVLKHINGSFIDVDFRRVAYCHTNGDFVDVFVVGPEGVQKVTVEERMKNLVDRLTDCGFVQTHRLCVVNIEYVIEDHPYPKSEIALTIGKSVPLARRRKLEFLAAYRRRPVVPSRSVD